MKDSRQMRVNEKTGAAKRGMASGTASGTRSVVLASADAEFRHRLSEMLTLQRWKVMEAGGGAEAMAYLESEPALALLVDTWLPDLEVGEFTAQLELMYPELDVLRVDAAELGGGGSQKSAGKLQRNNPHRGELLYALRQAQEMAFTGPSDEAAWNSAADAVPVAVQKSGVYGSAMARAFSEPVMDWSADGPSSSAFNPTTQVIGNINVLEDEVLPISVLPAMGTISELPRMESWGEQSAGDVHSLPIAELVGESAVMRELVRSIRIVAPRKTTVLLQGPTGSGKEVVAQALHRLSPRRNKSFTVLNCAAIPESLLEAELFGHSRGAFTGAVTSRTGRIEAAHLGTLFLDEIGEMAPGLQSKLLRFLENGELQRVGENENVKVDVRVIAATHQPLEEHIKTGRFRADLYHRITVFPIWVPALAERMDDIPLLANYFLQQMGEEMPIKRLSPGAMEKLFRHDWPGNVRELAHVLERAVILSEGRPEIQVEEIRFHMERRGVA